MFRAPFDTRRAFDRYLKRAMSDTHVRVMQGPNRIHMPFVRVNALDVGAATMLTVVMLTVGLS